MMIGLCVCDYRLEFLMLKAKIDRKEKRVKINLID